MKAGADSESSADIQGLLRQTPRWAVANENCETAFQAEEECLHAPRADFTEELRKGVEVTVRSLLVHLRFH